MSYELLVSDEAGDDLRALIDSLPASHRRDALNGVDSAVARLAANPMLAQRKHLGRPTYHFQFVAGGVTYHWGCTFVHTQDETSIRITHIYRVLL
jgi:hypothetical protein